MILDRHISYRLAAYADGQLDAKEVDRVDRHLAACPRCRSALDQIRLAAALLEKLPVVEAPDSIWRAIEAAPAAAPVPIRRWRLAAAFIVLVAAVAYWYSVRPPRTRWEVLRIDGSASSRQNIGAGEWLQTDGRSRARIKVGEIGTVEVEPNTRLRVVTARSAEHRLALVRGEISANILAPPRLFFVETASSTAVDLGCAYKMRVDDAGIGMLRVTAGWVSLEWDGRESLVPAGASCRTRPRLGPGTPHFDDAPDRLAEALDRFDFHRGGTGALDIVIAESRVRDTLTLWHLLSRVDPAERPRIFERMVNLTPLPAGISREKALSLDKDTLKRWKEELAWTW